jgi:hypothetical protein
MKVADISEMTERKSVPIGVGTSFSDYANQEGNIGFCSVIEVPSGIQSSLNYY